MARVNPKAYARLVIAISALSMLAAPFASGAADLAISPQTTDGPGEDDVGVPIGVPIFAICAEQDIIATASSTSSSQLCLDAGTADRKCGGTATGVDDSCTETFGFSKIKVMYLYYRDADACPDLCTTGSNKNYFGHTKSDGSFHNENMWWKDRKDGLVMAGCEEFVQKKWHGTEFMGGLSADSSFNPDTGLECNTGAAKGRWGAGVQFG